MKRLRREKTYSVKLDIEDLKKLESKLKDIISNNSKISSVNFSYSTILLKENITISENNISNLFGHKNLPDNLDNFSFHLSTYGDCDFSVNFSISTWSCYLVVAGDEDVFVNGVFEVLNSYLKTRRKRFWFLKNIYGRLFRVLMFIVLIFCSYKIILFNLGHTFSSREGLLIFSGYLLGYPLLFINTDSQIIVNERKGFLSRNKDNILFFSTIIGFLISATTFLLDLSRYIKIK